MKKKKCNVVSIFGGEVDYPKARKECVAVLVEQLNMAKGGEIDGLAILRQHSDGAVSFKLVGIQRHKSMAGGCLDMLDAIRGKE